MAELFGFLIIGFFLGGIAMAVVYGIVDKYTETNARYEITIIDNKANKYIAFRCDSAELVVDGTKDAVKKLQKDNK
jgi:hypothetical protein